MQVGSRTLIAKTCVVCGLLKDAKHFMWVQKIYRCAWCTSCKNNQSAAKTKDHQQKALKGARKSGQPWTGEDLNRLETMLSDGHTVPQIAIELERTVYAVYTMKDRLFKES